MCLLGTGRGHGNHDGVATLTQHEPEDNEDENGRYPPHQTTHNTPVCLITKLPSLDAAQLNTMDSIATTRK
jgi:hypothetical protein